MRMMFKLYICVLLYIDERIQFQEIVFVASSDIVKFMGSHFINSLIHNYIC